MKGSQWSRWAAEEEMWVKCGRRAMSWAEALNTFWRGDCLTLWYLYDDYNVATAYQDDDGQGFFVTVRAGTRTGTFFQVTKKQLFVMYIVNE